MKKYLAALVIILFYFAKACSKKRPYRSGRTRSNTGVCLRGFPKGQWVVLVETENGLNISC